MATFQVFDNYDAFFAFFVERANALRMEVEKIPLHDLNLFGWKVRVAPNVNSGRVSYLITKIFRDVSPFFFTVIGVRVLHAFGRNQEAWAQPMFGDETDGRIGLFVFEDARLGPLALVRCFAEPGNVGYTDKQGNTRVLIGPSFAFSQANLQLDKKPPLHQVFDRFDFDWIKVHGEGGRCFEKVNLGAIYLLTHEDFFWLIQHLQSLPDNVAEDFAWVPVGMLRQIRDEGFAGAHLLHVMGIMF